MSRLFWNKVRRVVTRKIDALGGSLFHDLNATLEAMAARPFELHLELTNHCNAECVFCPYQFQERPKTFMSDEVFKKAVGDFVKHAGGSISLTPIVGDALIDPKFLERVKYLRSLPEIDRIFVVTNAILVDKFGAREILTSGLTSITISTSGFEAESYKRIYRSPAYNRMRDNVLTLLKENAALGNPVNISIGLRTDRSLDDVMKDPDFQPILAFKPELDFTWSYTSAGGRIKREALPESMKLRSVSAKKEACASLYNGPIILPNGDALLCSCVAAMDAVQDLKIGNVLEQDLLEMYASDVTKKLRAQFETPGKLNKTCSACDMYRDLELYRTKEGRQRAELNRIRLAGKVVRRSDKAQGIFKGG